MPTRSDALAIFAAAAFAVGVALPALGRAREAAGKQSCQDRMRAIGASLHDYHAAHGTLPAYRTTRPKMHGWVQFLLPHLGQESLARQFRPDVHWYQQDAAFLTAQMSGLYCPSAEPNRTSAGVEPDGVAWTAGCSDYAAFSTLDNSISVQYPPGADVSGAMPRDFYRKLSGFGDGTAYSVMVGEIAGRPAEWRTGPTRYAAMQAFPNKGPWAAELNHINARGHTADGAETLGPCAVNCSNKDGVFGFHPAGANVVMADGSVRLLAKTLPADVLFALVTANYGEPLSPEDF